MTMQNRKKRRNIRKQKEQRAHHPKTVTKRKWERERRNNCNTRAENNKNRGKKLMIRGKYK